MYTFQLPPVRAYNIVDDIDGGVCTSAIHFTINKNLSMYLNKLKEQIDSKQEAWDRCKKLTNPYEYINTVVPSTRSPVCTLRPLSRSFFKMIELSQQFALLNHLPASGGRTFHLAEGPGGFIEALVYLRQNALDTYYGMTLLEPGNHTVPGWRKSKQFLAANANVKLEYGFDGTGDLTHAENFVSCYEKYGSSMQLITADGGFDFSQQYPQQEEVSGHLLFAQIMFALALQAPGGALVVKFFDTFTQLSVELLYLLSTAYDHVTLTKPNTSRSANSEKYCVCQGFRLVNVPTLVCKVRGLLERGALRSFLRFETPHYFLNKIEEFNAVLGQVQLDTIDLTLTCMVQQLLGTAVPKKPQLLKCVNWCQKHNLPYNKSLPATNNFFSNSLPCNTRLSWRATN